MRKVASFHKYNGEGWPETSYLKPFFTSPTGQEWFYEWGNDSAALWLFGDDEERWPPGSHPEDVILNMTGNPEHGVTLEYRKGGGVSYMSKGDQSRLLAHVDSLHGTPMSIGLFVPFRTAWHAVQEFMETNGQLPKSIEWVKDTELPEGTFPDPEALYPV